jgi:hypothetical protein
VLEYPYNGVPRVVSLVFGFLGDKPYFSVHPFSGMIFMPRCSDGRIARNFLLIFMLTAAPCTWAQGGESISLFVKTTVYPFDSTQPSGHGKVEATLRYSKGAPIPGQVIELNSAVGTFSCKLPDILNEVDSSSSDNACFTTGKDGKIIVYLINIPFNSQGTVTASCEFNGIAVKASSTFWVKKMVVKKYKAKKNPRNKILPG